MRYRNTDPTFTTVKYDTAIQDDQDVQHPCTIEYTRIDNTEIIDEYKVSFHYGTLTGEVLRYLDEIVREIIEGLEGEGRLEFQSKLVIE